jgi:hypothetical protein
VSQAFTKLKLAALIDLRQSNRVRLIDIERLKSLEGNEAEI